MVGGAGGSAAQGHDAPYSFPPPRGSPALFVDPSLRTEQMPLVGLNP